MGTLLEKAYAWLREEKWALATAFAAATIVYGSALFMFSLSIDDEIALMHGAGPSYIAQGRWGVAALQATLIPAKLSPFFTPLLSLSLLSAAAVVMSGALRLKGCEKYVFCALYPAFPQFAYLLVFSSLSESAAMGLLLCALSFFAFARYVEKRRAALLLPAFVAYTFAIGVYQALFLVPPALCALYCVGRWLLPATGDEGEKEGGMDAPGVLQGGEALRLYAFFICLALAALAVHVGVSALVRMLASVPASDYLRSMVGWLSTSPGETIAAVGNALANHLSGGAYYGEGLFIAVYPPLLCIGARFLRRRPPYGGVMPALGLLAAFIAPFLLIICLGAEQAPRTLLAQGIVFAALWAFMPRVIAVPRVVLLALVGICVLFSSAHVSRLFFQNSLQWEADKLLANRVLSRIYEAVPSFSAENTKVYIHGAPKAILPRIPGGDTFGSSFFSHDGGNIYRTQAFFKVHGIASFIRPSRAEILSSLDEVRRMPEWPHAGSVAMVGSLLVVKLGPEAGYIEDVPLLWRNP